LRDLEAEVLVVRGLGVEAEGGDGGEEDGEAKHRPRRG
jgi:hypothetical protein